MKKTNLLLAIICFSITVAASETLLEDDFKTPNTKLWQDIKIFHPFSAVFYAEDGLTMARNEQQQPIKGRLFDTAFDLRSKPVALPKGATGFDLSLLIGASNPLNRFHGFRDTYHCRLLWFDAEGKRMDLETKYTPSTRFPLTAPGWSTVRGAIPEGAAKAEVHFGFDMPDLKQGEKLVLSKLIFTVGTTAEIAALPVKGALPFFVHRTSPSPTDDGKAPVVLQVEAPQAVDWANLKVLLDGKDITHKVVRSAADTLTYTPEEPLAQGPHFFKVSVQDISGDANEATCVVGVGIPPSPVRMTVREDGMAMKDGKPFFVLGLACLVKQGRNGNSYDKAFEEAAAAGVNFTRHWSAYNITFKDSQEYIDAARKHHIYIQFNPTSNINENNVEDIVAGILRQKHLDCVLLWKVGDDTSSWITPEQHRAKYEAIKAVDPWRLTQQGDTMGLWGGKNDHNTSSRYTDYAFGSDIFSPQMYFVGCCKPGMETPERTAQMVPAVIRDMKYIKLDWKRNGIKQRTIWPSVQYFHYAKTSSMWNRMPTRDELRAMSYLSVIHGSHGVYWYRYAGYKDTPNATRGYSDEQWATLTSVIREFKELYGMYCEMPVPQTQTATLLSGPATDGLGYDSVNSLLKEHDGKKYLIVCNSAMADIRARFAVPGVAAAKEFFEKRELAVSDNAFEDAFGPYGVHVYEMK
jgi:hypothetical protein